MNPWPAAHTFLPTPDGPRQLKVFSSIQHRRVSGPAGVVLRADRRGLLVGAGTGAVLLREVQMEGKKRMPAGEFLRGHPVAAGTLLGAR
jgi:methionyl-tRNA formyltransferase